MSMKETGMLSVLGDYSFADQEIVINPNDGFDIGLMQTEATVQLYLGGGLDALEGEPLSYARVIQKNECRLGTVEMSLRNAQKLNEPGKVRLHLLPDDPYPRLLIDTV